MISSQHDNAGIISSKRAAPLSNYCSMGCYHGPLIEHDYTCWKLCAKKRIHEPCWRAVQPVQCYFQLPRRQVAWLQGYENSSVILRVSKKKKKISASQNNLEAYLMQAIPWPQIATEAKQNWCESFLHEVNQEKTGQIFDTLVQVNEKILTLFFLLNEHLWYEL